MLKTTKQIKKDLETAQKIVAGLTNINGTSEQEQKYFIDVIKALETVKDIYQSAFSDDVKISI